MSKQKHSIGYDVAPDGTRFEIIYAGDNKFSLLVDGKIILLSVRWDTIKALSTALNEAKSNAE